jgi:Cu(I)/Ag(I) efflux system membrane fusion protein
MDHVYLTMGRALTVFVALAGCGSDPVENPKGPEIQVVTGHVKPPEGAFEKASFPCCGDPGAALVVKAFSDLGATLAADDVSGSLQGAGQLAAAIESAAPEAEAASLADAPGALRAATDLAGVRAAYLEASSPMLAYVAVHRGGQTSYAIAYCPMKPGRWVQSESELSNPYYGAEMLRCGTFESLKSEQAERNLR